MGSGRCKAGRGPKAGFKPHRFRHAATGTFPLPDLFSRGS
jgi:hypothetical protein